MSQALQLFWHSPNPVGDIIPNSPGSILAPLYSDPSDTAFTYQIVILTEPRCLVSWEKGTCFLARRARGSL